ncbi:MAG: 23S rRNA (adenine(2503)-C(2))-methyltransferase RlmN [Acidobacteria bacterium]|nr:23S rRNA (adenine(2503)-C(2))-methyltransferase RlmN [Acidobacteriota bacterium]
MPRPAAAQPDPARLPNLFGMDRVQIATALAPHTARVFHSSQVFHWMYGRLQTDIQAMTDLPVALRAGLAGRFRVAWPEVIEVRRSADGSEKYLCVLEDGGEVEAVYILYGSRVTLCLSSQIGCPLACRFCLTGTMGLLRNLSPGEILGQIAVIARDHHLAGTSFRIVFMGMGEPLLNYNAVMRAFRVMVDAKAFGLSPRRVTLSTAGLVPGIERLARENPRPRLAISLGATTDDRRDDLMPINRKYDLEALLAACRRVPLESREKVTFEYCLIDGLNDREEDAARVARLVRGLPSKVNVIPYNEAGVPGFKTPPAAGAGRFRDALLARGVAATIRWSKGRDVGAACGQLVTATAR